MTQQQAQRQAPAPWRTLFSTHLSQNSTTSFTLSTVAYDAANRPVPRSRTCEFRGFFPNPALHPTALEALNTQADGPNPAFYESDYLSLTTDVRMDKTHQIGESGGLVEGVFWLADVRQQWRIKGVAFVVGDPDGGELENNSRNEILKGMRCGELGQEGKEEDGKRWSWDRLVTSYFANHSPVMRGSFKNPPPGQPRAQCPTDPNLKLGQKVDDLHDPVARRNFRVVVIRPEELERLDIDNLERQRWTLVGDEQWEEVELWP